MSRRVVTSMGLQRLQSLLRVSPLVSVLALGACASVLGIEDISSGPAPGAAGDNGTGNSSSGGNAGIGGKTSPPSGGNDSEAGEGPSVNGGHGNEAGSINVPIAGEGGGGNTPGDPTVRGRVVDMWGKPLINISVQIGDDLQTTDANGEFTCEDVPNEYDVSMVIRPDGRDFGWVFQGLTRRNPTLQVYEGRNSRWRYALMKATNITLGANDTISVGVGTPDGAESFADVTDAAAGENNDVDWFGPTTTSGNAHALAWTYSAATELPTSYLAYDSGLIALSTAEDAALTFDLTPETLDDGNVAGTATPVDPDADRGNGVFVHFDSGANIRVVEHTPTTNNFSYLVPSVPSGSITVSAWEGDSYGPLGLAHRDGLAPGTTNVELDIPAPPHTLRLQPAGDADAVDQETTFAFSASPDNAGAFVVWLENADFYQTLYIVTTKKEFTIPTVVGGAFVLDPAQQFRWRVETHGDFATVDEMTTSAGYIDEFGRGWTSPSGPNATDGSFTLSGAFVFTTAP
jgi:hypothetical protein